ncbi:non-canonical purine NTP pyrophosphatase [Methylobacterium pseudosasicola]|uniref:non-canonical purine NTP pyrophosphatase n=1 Tax=Methylobacterium pseudosasicola TaxID=582667 RepID=UPI000B88E84D|nr:non-canonical purine NTP pyrophosphatase [Methylobacterium pseudosasicola]
MRVRFLSGNDHKIKEATKILGSVGVTVVPISIKLNELQTNDIDTIVSDKAAKAFHKIGHPLFVEQTGLFIERLNGFPGGLTQVFWDTIGPDRVTEIFGQGTDTGVMARTFIGYCDGRSIYKFQGEIRGNIASSPRGNRDFQWDCIFVPEGSSETFAEMGDRKNDISMRRLALTKLSVHLGGK